MEGRLNGVSCFAGIGGFDLAVREDVRTVCYIEWDRYCQEVLKKRMQEGFLDDAPIWGDISTFSGKEWAGRVDIVFGGFPCQDISVAGKGAGIKEGTRSGLFYQLMRVVGEIRPRFVFLENVSAITNRGCDVVLGELSKAGYDAVWTTLRASDVGARHRRERWFALAYSNGNKHIGVRESSERESGENYQKRIFEKNEFKWGRGFDELESMDIAERISSYPEALRTLNGIPYRMDRLKCLGNAVVPQQGREDWRRLWDMI